MFTDIPVDINPVMLASSLKDAFERSGLVGPFSTETNDPNNSKKSPIVKVETSSGENGIWIGSNLIFIPIGNGEDDYSKLVSILRATELSNLPARSYSLNSSRQTIVGEEMARRSTNSDIVELLASEGPQEFSKNITKLISDKLVAKDTISITRHKPDGLIVDMTIGIDSANIPGGQTVGDLISQIDIQILRAHEDEIKQQADSIIIGL